MSQNPELTPAILAELQSALEAKRDRLRAAIVGLRSGQNEEHAETVDVDDDLRGDRGDSSVELEEWDESHQEELDEEDRKSVV